MTEYLVTLSLLICAVLLIRGLFCKTVSPRVIYALWLAVVIRMLLPVSLFEADIPMPVFGQIGETVQTETHPAASTTGADVLSQTPVTSAVQAMPTVPSSGTAPGTSVIPPANEETQSEVMTATLSETDPPAVQQSPAVDTAVEPMAVNWNRIADLTWFCGAVITSLWVLLTSIGYTRQLKKDRTLHKTVRGTKVYISDYAGVPCIAGLIPSIYITPEAADSRSETLIIIHEYTHLRHGDHIWAGIRALALTVFWWNPLMWIAAMVSKQDAELACDDAIAARLDDETRLRYAHILLDTIPQKHRYADRPSSVHCLGSTPMKKRILMLTKKQKNKGICLVLALILTGCAVGCSFVGKPKATMDNIQRQNGFTILSQETKEVDLTLPFDLLPSYEDIVSAEEKRIESDGIAVFTTDTTEVLLYTVGISGHKSKGIDEDVLYLHFDIRHTLSDAGTVYNVHRVMNEDNRYSYGSVVYVTKETLQTYDRGIRLMGSGPSDHFDLCIDAVLYAALQGDVNIGITLNQIVYEPGSDARIYGSEIADVQNRDSSEKLTFIPLMHDPSEKISLSYHADDPTSDLAEQFCITIGDYEAYISPKSAAWLRYTWEPQLYCTDIALPGMPADGIEDAVVILTTGTGTGIHIEEAHVVSGADGTLHSFTEPYTVVENLVERGENGAVWMIDASGNPIDLPDNAYFNQRYTFYIEDGCLYAKVPIGYDVWQYTKDYFVVQYKSDGAAGVYVSTDSQISSVEFDPVAFAELIPNSAAEPLLYHRFMASDTYIYLCAIHEWNGDGTWSAAPPKDFAVYYTQDFGKTVGMADMTLPDDLAYDTVTPVMFGPGGGSMELQIILRLTVGDTTFYVSFDNFTDSGNDGLGFAYRGLVSDDEIEAYQQLQIGAAINAKKTQQQISLGGEWYHNYRHSAGYAFYSVSFSQDTAEMTFDHGAYESEYAHRYRGSYTVDPVSQTVTAVLYDSLHKGQNMTLEFRPEMDATQEDTLVMHIVSCNSADYQHLVGQSLSFTKESDYQAFLDKEAQRFMESWYNGDMTTDALLNEYAVRLHLATKIHAATGIALFAYDFRWEYRANEDRYPLRFLLSDDDGTKVIETVIVKAVDETDGKEKFFVDVNPTVIKDA